MSVFSSPSNSLISKALDESISVPQAQNAPMFLAEDVPEHLVYFPRMSNLCAFVVLLRMLAFLHNKESSLPLACSNFPFHNES